MFVAGGGEIPVAAKVSVGIDFKALVSVGVKRDSLRSRSFQIFDKVDDSVVVGRSRILGEASALMRRLSTIWPGALLQ